jgi:hypothetical protein
MTNIWSKCLMRCLRSGTYKNNNSNATKKSYNFWMKILLKNRSLLGIERKTPIFLLKTTYAQNINKLTSSRTTLLCSRKVEATKIRKRNLTTWFGCWNDKLIFLYYFRHKLLKLISQECVTLEVKIYFWYTYEINFLSYFYLFYFIILFLIFNLNCKRSKQQQFVLNKAFSWLLYSINHIYIKINTIILAMLKLTFSSSKKVRPFPKVKLMQITKFAKPGGGWGFSTFISDNSLSVR